LNLVLKKMVVYSGTEHPKNHLIWRFIDPLRDLPQPVHVSLVAGRLFKGQGFYYERLSTGSELKTDLIGCDPHHNIPSTSPPQDRCHEFRPGPIHRQYGSRYCYSQYSTSVKSIQTSLEKLPLTPTGFSNSFNTAGS